MIAPETPETPAEKPTERTRAEAREAWLAERKKGIGGSDVASVFSTGYGCRLRLWRDKRNEVPDYPREENAAMELGQFLEPYFAARYQQVTGRRVVERYEAMVHPRYPYLRVNIDRMINDTADTNREVGVLEIKSVGRSMFYKIKREGLPEDYILQLQQGILVTGSDWGAFAIGSRDTGELLHWDVMRDDALGALIIAEGGAFWQEVLSGEKPDRLDPDDRRCQKCEYRRSCQGAALLDSQPSEGMAQDETLRPILTEYLERKVLLDQAEELTNESKEQLKTEIGTRQAVAVGGHKIYFRPQTSMRGDFKTLATQYDLLRHWMLEAVKDLAPEEAAKFVAFPTSDDFRHPSESRPLRIY